MATKKQTAQPQPSVVFVDEAPEPTITRTFSSLVAGGVVTGSLGYGGMALVGAATVGVAVLTTSAFLVYMTWYLGVLVTIVGAIMAGSYVQARLLDGSLDKTFARGREYVVSKLLSFSSRKEVTP